VENVVKATKDKRSFYSIGVDSFDNVTNEARSTPELKKLARFLVGNEYFWPALKRECGDVHQTLPMLSGVEGSSGAGFFSRAHFVLDDHNRDALALWKRWLHEEVTPQLPVRRNARGTSRIAGVPRR
jgi:hypothetical protein